MKQGLRAAAVLATVLALAGCNHSSPRLSNEAGGVTGRRGFDEAVARLVPASRFQSRIRLGDSVVKLVRHGVIDKPKFEKLHADRGGFPQESRDVLAARAAVENSRTAVHHLSNPKFCPIKRGQL